MNRVGKRSGITLIIALLLVAGLSFFVVEYVTQAETWVIHTGSPHVYNGGNINCGAVVDKDGVLLLDLVDGREYAQTEDLRKATLHWLGDRYGYVNAPAVAFYASEMAGFDLANGVYDYGDATGVAELTLSAQVQKAALDAMGDKKGVVAVYNYKTGQLLCSVTTPSYDPDNVPDIAGDTTGAYEGAYVNRFTQSVYTPGSIFKIVTLAAALEEIPGVEDQSFTCSGKMEFGPDTITCEDSHGKQSLKAAFRNSCNCAFAQLALQLGGDKLQSYVEAFGITAPVNFDGITTAKGSFTAAGQADVQVGWSGVGQHLDQVNPCAFLTFVGAVANGGQGAQPYVVEKISVGKTQTYQAQSVMGDKILSPETAQTVMEYMRNNVSKKYGDDNFPGLTVCAKTGTAEVGGEKKPNAMLSGFVSDENYPLAFIVCVEDGGYGAKVCLPIASKVLSACKNAMDPG